MVDLYAERQRRRCFWRHLPTPLLNAEASRLIGGRSGSVFDCQVCWTSGVDFACSCALLCAECWALIAAAGADGRCPLCHAAAEPLR